MLISDTRRTLFVHVPKTGGVSVEEVLLDACEDARKRTRAGVLDDRRHAALGQILASEPDLAGYWTFGFVRNPWARLVSWYSMIQRWNRRWGPASGKPQDVSYGAMRDGNETWRAVAAYADFEEFVLRGLDELPRIGQQQIDYLRDPATGRTADFIGRTEQLADDLQVVQRHLGVEPTPAPHRNRSREKGYRDAFSHAARAKVARAYAEDIELFGYTF